jgi:thioredoxin 1
VENIFLNNMNKNTGIVVGIIILAALVGGVYASMSNKDDAMMKDKVGDTSMMKKEDTSIVDKGVEKSDLIMKKGSYEAYAPEKLARAETGDVVLFFHASWCPSCRGLNSDIETNMSSIPEGVSILKVDYDKEVDLKKKYGVTTQHTLVQVDKDGNLIKKWSGSSKLAVLVSEIK